MMRVKTGVYLALTLCFVQAIAAVRLPPRAEELAQHERSTRLFEKDITNATGQDVNAPVRKAGYFKLDRSKDAHMFYFFFESRTDQLNNNTDPLVVWMTGGPGCSSELAVFYENGPYRINDDLSLKDNIYGWDASHNMIFVDQPIGTGFSYSKNKKDEVTDEKTVASDMIDFLTEFMKAYPQYDGRELFITGESYAGHYVPAVTYGIWNANKQGAYFNLKGFAIGNGLTDPYWQYAQYANFSLQNGLIDEDTFNSVQKNLPVCQLEIKDCYDKKDAETCMEAVDYCQSDIVDVIMLEAGDINVYDIRKTCGDNPLCYDFSNLEKYLEQKDVLDEYGIPSFVHWESCDDTVHNDFMHDWMLNYEPIIPPMLESGIRGMIYAGVEDFICNWLGNYAWVQEMQWSGQENFLKAEIKDWTDSSGATAGTVQSAGGFSFVKVKAAGHMVPMDQPANALKMISSFTRNHPLT